MHAVVVDVSISDRETAERQLREQVVPRVSQAPGFVAGFWLEPIEGKGHSIAVFESEEAARGMADMVQSNAPAPVTIDNVEVRAVVANA
jgi:hypothetical protein